MKRLLASILATSLLLLTGCQSTDNSSDNAQNTQDTQQTTNDTTADVVKIGVLQFGSHPSLDNCYTGILEGLESADFEYEIIFQNGNFDSAQCDALAKNLVASGCEVIIPIATPAAISAYSATQEKQIPVIFTAVSDPIAAGLIDSIEVPGGHATGSASVINLDSQIDMILKTQPDVQKIGVLYTTSEANSVTDIKRLREIGEARGIEIIDQGIQTSAEIPQALADLVTKVDAINNLADNNVVNNLGTVLEIANSANIPVYGSEEEQVLNGCLASEGIDYIQVGIAASDLAIEVITNGADPATLPVTVINDSTPFFNEDVLKDFNLTIPTGYENATILNTPVE